MARTRYRPCAVASTRCDPSMSSPFPRIKPFAIPAAAGLGARAAQAALRFAIVVVALHAPSWITAWVFQAPRAEERPLVNLDLLLAAAIACVSTVAGGVALVLAWAADFIRAAAKNYHFMSAMDFVDAARFVDMLNLRMFVSASLLVVVAGLVICAWAVLSQTRRARWMAWPLILAVFLSAGFDVVNGSFHIFGLAKDSRVVSVNFAGSPLWNVWSTERRSLLASGPPVPMPSPMAYRALQAWQGAHPDRTSMLVLVESMGLPKDPALQAWLMSRLATQRLQSRWVISQSDDEFRGSTTSGELRTLCGLQGHYSRLDDTLTADCLPSRLAAQGQTSIGIHGFGLRMFDRAQWWPRIGLTPWHWPEDEAKGWPMHCNLAFPGVCDGAVLDQAVKEAQQPGRFVYALTLDTHLPLDLPHLAPLPDELRVACRRSVTPNDACRLVQRLGEVLARLEQSLASARATPYVVVVGDHAPPFGEAANREAFAQDRVPMFVMTPR